MKKKILFLAAAATVLASCYDVREIGNDIKDNAPAAIGFNTISEKATRATASDLETYHKTFSVWSTKKSNNNVNAAPEIVFNGDSLKDIITFKEGVMEPTNWTYSPYRYWDKQATYNFIAVAPNAKIVRFDSPENVADNAGTFITADTAGYTLVGTNLQTTTPADAEIMVGFTGADGKDTDIMTSGKVTRNGASSVEDVNLSFKHILAKLNISIAKDAIFDNVKVLIRDVKVTGLDDTGKYFEATSNNNSAWSSSLKDANYQLSWEKADGYELPKSVTEGNKQVAQYKYFIESLIMPQSIEEETEKLTIDYTIVSGSNRENYNYVLSLNDSLGNKVFDNFMESNNYTLKLTIKPNVITFDASTDAWTDQTASQNSATAMQP